MERFLLASGSPQRASLLKGIDFVFEVIPSSVDEDNHAELNPLQRSQVLARLKAEDVAAQYSNAWVLGCDTLVVAADGTLLEKPKDEADARSMIARQSGGVSIVHSALCLITPDGTTYEDVSSSRVTFKNLSTEEIDWWMATGLWKDRSGSFQIDGKGQMMIAHLEGDWSGVVGLPLYLFGELLRRAKWSV